MHSDSLPIIWVAGGEVSRRLDELGLTLTDIREVVEFARIQWAATTSDHPRVFPGIEVWGHAIGQWRARLGVWGWLKRDDNNYPIAIHPSGNWAVTVEGGTRSTGIPSETPATRNSKGKSTKSVVAQNQLSFWDVRPDLSPLVLETWILLIFMDRKTYRARAELSLPLGLDRNGRASDWAERIIIPLDDSSAVNPRTGLAGPNEDPNTESGTGIIRRIG